MRIAYLAESANRSRGFPFGNRKAKSTLEDRLPDTTADIFRSPAHAVGENWDGPLFSRTYDLIISGVMMQHSGTPLDGKECYYGRTTGIHILRKIREPEKKTINCDTPYLIISVVTDPNYLKQVHELMNERDRCLVSDDYFKLNRDGVTELIKSMLSQ